MRPTTGGGRRRPRPNRTQRAAAQQQTYVSQGQAVQHAATQQKRAASTRPVSRPQSLPSVAFRPIASQAQPFKPQIARAHHATRMARSQLPDHPAIPHFPVLGISPRSSAVIRQVPIPLAIQALKSAASGPYTDPQVRAIMEGYRAGARKAGVRSISELFQLGSLRQRKNMIDVGRAIAARAQSHDVAQRNARDGQLRAGPHVSGGAAHGLATITAGLIGAGGGQSMAGISPWLIGAAKIGGLGAINLARATAEDPAAVASSSLRTAKESITGIPQAVTQMIAQVNQQGLVKGVGMTLDAIAADYERRYGPILHDPARFREQVKRDYGLTPFVFDAAMLGGTSGQLAGALARSGPAGRAAAALAHVGEASGSRAVSLAGRVAHGVHTAAVEQRPGLRFSAGEAGVRQQKTSGNLWVALAQHRLDAARVRQAEHMTQAARLEEGPGGRLITRRNAQGYHEGTRLPALRPGDNEVVARYGARVGSSTPFRGVTIPSVRELPTLRRYTGRAARDLGGQQSITRLRLLTHRGRVLNRIDKIARGLSDDEKRAMKYMLQLGATPDGAGTRVLQRRLAQIRRARNGQNITPILESTNDEVRLIREILREPDRFLTPNARAAGDELRAIQLEQAAVDPHLAPDQELIRRLTPQGAALGVIRGPDVRFFRGVLGGIERHRQMPGVAQHADPLAFAHPSERPAIAAQMGADLQGQVRAAERNVETARRREQVWGNVIRNQEQHGVPLQTPEVRQARMELASAKRDRRLFGAELSRTEKRAVSIASRLGERDRIGPPIVTDAVHEARRRLGTAQRDLNRLQNEVAAIERRAGRRIGEAMGRETRGRNRAALEAESRAVQLDAQLRAQRDLLKQRQRELQAIEKATPRLTPTQFQDRQLAGAGASEAMLRYTDSEAAVKAAAEHLKQMLEQAPRVTEASYRRLLNRQLELNAARATRDYVREFEQAFRDVVRAAKSKDTMRLEDAQAFATKVRQVAEQEGLTEPAYWWSSVRPEQLPSLAAAGRGLGVAHRNRAYTGKLFDVGAEEHGFDVFTRGVERNIKRRFQTALVMRNLETHAFEWSRGPSGAGLTAQQIKHEMDVRFIDPSTIELVDAKMIDRRPTEPQGVERGQVLTGEELQHRLDAITAAGHQGEDFVSTTQQMLAAARRRWKDVSADELRGLSQNRYLVVTRDVGETLDGVANKMDSPGWRALEIILKQKPARILLGAANIPWLAFQIASNAFLTGLGGALNPMDIYGAAKWFRSLSHEERDAIEAELGITHGHHFALDETNLGASSKRLVNTWRAFKKTKTMRIGHTINPLNVMFRLDEKQNNFFRRTLFYSKARRASYARMGHAWHGIDQGISYYVDRISGLPPGRQADMIARHGQVFEDVAKHVTDFLGDYVRYTPSERFLLSRNVMFYGYLRFSLRFAFYTMPVGHPVMTSILANLGQLGAQEIKDLFGVSSNYDLPASMLAQVYFGNRADAQAGRLRSLPLGRFNPFLNALTQLDGAQQAFGLVSPIYQALVDQMFQESSFTGKDWRIEGRSTPSQSERPKNYYGNFLSLLNPGAYATPGITAGHPRNRILEEQLLKLIYPYRAAEQVLQAPNQSDDALLWQPQPMMYADPKAQAGVARSRRGMSQVPLAQRIGGAILPIFPRTTAAPQVVAREQAKQQAEAKRRRRKPGQRAPRRRGTAGGGSRYGGGSAARYGGSSGSSRYGG